MTAMNRIHQYFELKCSLEQKLYPLCDALALES